MASKTNGVDTLSDWARGPPVTGSGWVRFGKAIYNSDDGSILGRTPKRWGIALIFYSVFYAVLAVMFSICMACLFLKLDTEVPTFQMTESLIGANPGVAFRPRNPVTNLVTYSMKNDSVQQFYIKQLEDFWKPYETDRWYTMKKECNAADNYGFPSTPCFFIKLNKIYGWAPQYYDDPAAMPADTPSDLLDYITSVEPKARKQIWLSCAPKEEHNSTTNLEYPWGRGMPSNFYPFTNQEGYRSPSLAVKITTLTENTLITIRCRLWAKNIIYNKSLKDPSGYTLIQIYYENGSYNVTQS